MRDVCSRLKKMKHFVDKLAREAAGDMHTGGVKERLEKSEVDLCNAGTYEYGDLHLQK